MAWTDGFPPDKDCIAAGGLIVGVKEERPTGGAVLIFSTGGAETTGGVGFGTLAALGSMSDSSLAPADCLVPFSSETTYVKGLGENECSIIYYTGAWIVYVLWNICQHSPCMIVDLDCCSMHGTILA